MNLLQIISLFYDIYGQSFINVIKFNF